MLQGTPYIYQGEEIGMTNVPFESIADCNDLETLNMYREQVDEKGRDPGEVMAIVRRKSRDNARTPMQWSAETQAGFSRGKPWLMVNPNYLEINVEEALADADLIFHYYRKLIQLRKTYPVVVYGSYDLILPEHEKIYAFTRTLEDERLLVVLNFSQDAVVFEMPKKFAFASANLVIGNYPVDSDGAISQIMLRPYEGTRRLPARKRV